MQLKIFHALLFQFLGRLAEARIVLAVFFQNIVLQLDLVDQVAAQIGFAEPWTVLVIRIGQLRDVDIGFNPAFLHRLARRRVIARRGQTQRAVVGQRQQRLDRALAETAFTHDQGTVMVLQGAGNDFRSRSRTGVDQHNDRQPASGIAALGEIALDIGFFPPALRDDFPARQEHIGNRNGFIEQTARIGPQVEHIAERLLAQGLVDSGNGGGNIGTGLAGETVDADHADLVLDLPGDRLEIDDRPFHRQIERLVAAGPDDGNGDRFAGLAAHFLYRLVQRAAVDQFAIDMGNIIASLHAGLVRRRILERSDDLHGTVFQRHRKAQAAIIAVGLGPQIFEIPGIQKAAVRIQTAQHALDRALDQIGIVDLIDIVVPHPLEDAHELLHLAIGIGIHGGNGRSRCGQKRNGQHKGSGLQNGLFHQSCPVGINRCQI